MAFEHKTQPLLSREKYLLRIGRYTLFSVILIGAALLLGVFGYHFLNDLSWEDAILNASMILSGMGPVDALKNSSAKIFASFYSIFSGVVFMSTVAVFLSPIAHRFLHKLHLDEEENEQRSSHRKFDR
jgi:hypothetical protein